MSRGVTGLFNDVTKSLNQSQSVNQPRRVCVNVPWHVPRVLHGAAVVALRIEARLRAGVVVVMRVHQLLLRRSVVAAAAVHDVVALQNGKWIG